MVRSVLSVLAGIVVLTVASFAIEAAVQVILLRTFPSAFPGPAALSANLRVRALTFTYGFVCVAGGGYVTAWISRRFPVRHAAAMGILQCALTFAAMLSPEAWHASRLQWIATAVVSIPAALAGGVFYRSRA